MERRPFTPRSSSEREDQRDALLKRLEAGVDAVIDDASFRAYLDMQSRFHKYSYGNTLLIMQQRPDATRVAGFHTWKKLERSVMKGEKGMQILVPIFAAGMKKEEQEQITPVAFTVGHVWDISQTQGKPLPSVEVPVLAGDPEREGYAYSLYMTMRMMAVQDHVRVEEVPRLDGDQMGYYLPHEQHLVIRTDVSQLQQTKTLCHELAHHVAKHWGTTDEDRQSEQETVAEGVAYVTLGHFGFDSGARSFPYIAHWTRTGEKGVIRKVLGEIQRVSNAIITGVERISLPHTTDDPLDGGGSMR